MRESDARTVAALRKWSVLLDSAFRVPGTNLTFGLDPIIGLIPWIGDITTPLFSARAAAACGPHAHPENRAAAHADECGD